MAEPPADGDGGPVGREGLWAVVEIMGHRTRAGRISDVTIGGATMLHIEHPTADPPAVEMYAPAAIFAIRPCSYDVAVRAAGYGWLTEQPTRLALARPLEDLVDDDDCYDEPDDDDHTPDPF